MKGLCESCAWEGEKCNVSNEHDEIGRIIRCVGHDQRDCVIRKCQLPTTKAVGL